ncbi:hypothetical protein CHCC20495_0018 [Bacillus licheniformis]|nr:hypothetical protein CHCC20495_0018 [Bacillus licheniformis]TWL83226.1 hypothetical protein CHCC15291_0902 [Bacillus licheniformis]TWM05804.1 hypothetical protein CHCC15289_1809 [Bacillus licheniformis]
MPLNSKKREYNTTHYWKVQKQSYNTGSIGHFVLFRKDLSRNGPIISYPLYIAYT